MVKYDLEKTNLIQFTRRNVESKTKKNVTKLRNYLDKTLNNKSHDD